MKLLYLLNLFSTLAPTLEFESRTGRLTADCTTNCAKWEQKDKIDNLVRADHDVFYLLVVPCGFEPLLR